MRVRREDRRSGSLGTIVSSAACLRWVCSCDANRLSCGSAVFDPEIVSIMLLGIVSCSPADNARCTSLRLHCAKLSSRSLSHSQHY